MGGLDRRKGQWAFLNRVGVIVSWLWWGSHRKICFRHKVWPREGFTTSVEREGSKLPMLSSHGSEGAICKAAAFRIWRHRRIIAFRIGISQYRKTHSAADASRCHGPALVAACRRSIDRRASHVSQKSACTGPSGRSARGSHNRGEARHGCRGRSYTRWRNHASTTTLETA